MLKKVSTIFFILLYLFNLAGYNIVFDYFIRQSNEHTIQKLDRGHYADSELIEIKIALNLPYYNNMDEYERYDGEIELNNTHYNFVKRKVYNDTLYLLCLPDYTKTELYKAKHEFAAKENNSDPCSKKGLKSFPKKNAFEKEHNQQPFNYCFLYDFILNKARHIDNPRLISSFIPLPIQPPEIIPS